MRAGVQQMYSADGTAAAYTSVYPSQQQQQHHQQQQYGLRPANIPGSAGHMGPSSSVVAQQGSRTEEALGGAAPGPMKGGGKASMFAGQQQPQQRSAPYPNPHRYMQSRRPFINGQIPEVQRFNTVACNIRARSDVPVYTTGRLASSGQLHQCRGLQSCPVLNYIHKRESSSRGRINKWGPCSEKKLWDLPTRSK